MSNDQGDTVFQMTLKGEPSQIKWNTNNSTNESILSLVLNSKSLFFYNKSQPDEPIELAFQSKYGTVMQYHWFNQDQIMIGFSSGYFIIISTRKSEIGQEIAQCRDFRDGLNDIVYSQSLNHAASSGDNCIKIHDLVDMHDVYAIITIEEERGQLDKLNWSDDGQFLSISTKDGSLYTYLTKLPLVCSSFKTKIAFLSGLKEITVSDQSTESGNLFKKDIDFEPSFIGVNNQSVKLFLI